MSTCSDCADLINRWIDAYQDMGPIRGWRQYQTSPDSRARRSAEMFSAKVDDRARLIQRQVRHIRDTCTHEDGAA